MDQWLVMLKKQNLVHVGKKKDDIYRHHLGPLKLFFIFHLGYNINQKHSPFLLVLSFTLAETDSRVASFKTYVYEPNTGKHASVSRDTNKGRESSAVYAY